MNSPLLFASIVAVSTLAVASDQDWDPTSPADTAKQQDVPAQGQDPAAPLSGPDVQSEKGGRGRDGMRGPSGGPAMTGGDSVQALLAARCASCHGPQKQKAGVQVVPIEMLFSGDVRDWVVIPGKPDQSELLTRVILPKGHEDIMPSEGEPLTGAEITRVTEWIRGNATKEKLIQAAGPIGGSVSRVDPRIWQVVYLSLDLTSTQRDAAMKVVEELKAQAGKGRARRGGASDASGSETARPGSKEEIAERRDMRQQREQVQRKIAEVQESLWSALSPKQQADMRAILEDPAAINKLKRAGRDRGGRGGRGERKPRQQPQ
ncbi:MAG: hypothetical protein P8M32_07185 [Phycisphaerales bacterium]|nr:hypothetical protein [Phycisphaerales bacterium]